MKKFLAEINIMPLDEILDPQGKAINEALLSLEFSSISTLRMGKHIRFEFESPSEKEASELVERTCYKLLVNPIVEQFKYTIRSLNK